MFIAIEEEIINIGKTSGGRLRDEIKTKRNRTTDKGANEYRWFRTNSDEVAKILNLIGLKSINQGIIKLVNNQLSVFLYDVYLIEILNLI